MIPMSDIKVTQVPREHRTDSGRFVPAEELANITRELIAHTSQSQAAGVLGLTPQAVSLALKGERPGTAVKIINHYAPGLLEGPLYYVPAALDEMLMEKSLPADDE